MANNAATQTCGALLRYFREQATPTTEEVSLRRHALAAQVEGLTAQEMTQRVTRRRGLTQEELVARSGLSVEGLRKIERDRVCPLDDTLLLLARALRLTDSECAALLAAAQKARAARAHRSRPFGMSALQRAVGDPLPPLGGVTRLPAPVTSFVGRQEDITRLVTLLRPHSDSAHNNPGSGFCRLITLTGPGGCGKSRLALAVAAQLEPNFADGTRLVGLAALPAAGAEVSPIEQAVAGALGLALANTPRPSLATLIGALQDRDVLLILDNLEHVVAACRAPIAALLRACTGLRILATSREALGIAGEWVWPVSPLSLPGGGEEHTVAGAWDQSDAVTLFAERVRSRLPDFTLDERTGATAAAICRRLDGLPLAIELAVARLPAISLTDLAARLDDSFALLSHGNSAALPRQQTLRATMDWSYRLLTPPGAMLLRRLAPFAGSCTFAAVTRTCVDTTLPAATMLDALAELVERSLVQTELSSVTSSGCARYSILETVRDYARTLLVEEDGPDYARTLYRRHLEWCLELAARPDHLSGNVLAEDLTSVPEGLPAGDQLAGSGAGAGHAWWAGWLSALGQEEGNLRAALGFAMATSGCGEQGLHLAAALWPFWLWRGTLREGRRWLALALEASGTRTWQQAPADTLTGSEPLYRARAEALYGAGRLAEQQGAQTQARMFFAEWTALCDVLHHGRNGVGGYRGD